MKKEAKKILQLSLRNASKERIEELLSASMDIRDLLLNFDVSRNETRAVLSCIQEMIDDTKIMSF